MVVVQHGYYTKLPTKRYLDITISLNLVVPRGRVSIIDLSTNMSGTLSAMVTASDGITYQTHMSVRSLNGSSLIDPRITTTILGSN